MKTVIPIIAFSCISFGAHAQNVQYDFTYDASGNCTSITTFNSNSSAPVIGMHEDDLEKVGSLSLCGKPITVITDKSNDIIVIEVAGWSNLDNCSITLYDMAGQQLSSRRATNERTTIDTGSLKPGVFLIGIALNNERTGIKMTKN